MKHPKMFGLAAVAAMAFTAFAASSASATTLEINGATQNGSVTLTTSLEPGTTFIFKDTAGFSANTCTGSHTHGITAAFTNPVTGPFTGHTAKEKEEGRTPESGWNFSGCTRPLTVHDPGTFEIIHIASTTNGTVYSENMVLTQGSPIGTLACQTGSTTHIGTLTGTGSPVGHATMHVNAVINCGIIPSAKWEGTFKVTTPTGLGVSA